MGFLERKWALALGVLILIVGFNGISGWMASRDEKTLITAETEIVAPETLQTPDAATLEEKSVAVAVYICGAVNSPGVYELPEGSRVKDAVDKAGGLSPKADAISVNLAEVVTDGQQIVIYEQGSDMSSSGSGGTAKAKSSGTAAPGLPVSINHGSLEALMLLDGVGEKTAQKIMDYRKSQGGFKSIEELKNVPGIGDKKFDQIKNDVKL